MRRGLGSSQQLLCSSLLLVVVTGWLLTCPPCLTSLSCLTASPAAMDTAYRESS